MKTLVIHPFDLTTGFLSEIYEGKDWMVIDFNPSTKELKQQIKDHDRIIMLGHGTEFGLLGFGRLIIDSRLVYLLREKECVYIWCNADKFVEKYKLKGFYTGMIISEHEEAIDYCIQPKKDEIYESNMLFSYSIRDSINSETLYDDVKTKYQSNTNSIIMFNQKNIYSTYNIEINL